jgi:enterochelin esterase-like enzyme
MMGIFSGFLLILADIVAAAGSDPSVVPMSGSDKGDQVCIQDTYRHEIKSTIIDDTFKIHVHYPRGYHDMKDPVPVVYLLDAEYSFGAVAYTIRRLIKDGLIPPVLLGGDARRPGDSGGSRAYRGSTDETGLFRA